MPFNKNIKITNPNRKIMSVADSEFAVSKLNKRVLEMLNRYEKAVFHKGGIK